MVPRGSRNGDARATAHFGAAGSRLAADGPDRGDCRHARERARGSLVPTLEPPEPVRLVRRVDRRRRELNPAQLLLVVGTRPNFVKVAPVAHALSLRDDVHTALLHTGQHYD